MYAEMFEAVDRFQQELAQDLPQGAQGMLFKRPLTLEELEQVTELARVDRELVHDA